MISIPLPFVVAFILSILMILLYIRREENTQAAFFFVALCVVAITVVGLRWTFDHQIFRLLQPILASFIPVTAWYCFSSAYKNHKLNFWHFLVPIFVTFCSFTYHFWLPAIDPILVLLYLVYGIALISKSYQKLDVPELLRLSNYDSALKAQRFAGIMLLISAFIDTVIAINFAFYAGEQVPIILSIGHIVLLPLYTIVVIVFSLSIAPSNHDKPEDTDQKLKDKQYLELSQDKINGIVKKVDDLFKSKEAFLDPDLTLDKLARKVGIPAKQISAAINQIHGRNISQVVNEYRIEKAKKLLRTTDKSITQVYFDSGFQTKSNFNREFNRVTKLTPSAFRRSYQK